MAADKIDIKDKSRFNINSFKSEILTKGVMRPQYFTVEIGKIKYLENLYGSNVDRITLRCESATLPGIDLQDGYNGPRAGYGVKEYIPYGVDHKNIPCLFILDEGTFVQDFFFRWMNSIVNFNNEKETTGVNSDVRHNGTRFNAYEVGYKDLYSATVTIRSYNPAGDQAVAVNLYRAFPVSVGEVPLSWNDTDRAGKLAVNFTFKDYEYQSKLTT